MKRSRAIQLTLVTSMASLLISCENRPIRYCVDESQNVADDKNCEDANSHGAPYHLYHWYYGGSRGPVSNGTHLSGGSTVAPSDGFISRSAASGGASERGVFGDAGEAASGGHGEGGGE